MSFGMDFFGFSLHSLLHFLSELDLLHSISFKPLFLRIDFKPHCLSPLLLSSQWYAWWAFCYCPTGPWVSDNFFLHYFLFLRLGEFCWPIPSSLDICSTLPESIQWIFTFLLWYFSGLKIQLSSLTQFPCFLIFNLFQKILFLLIELFLVWFILIR